MAGLADSYIDSVSAVIEDCDDVSYIPDASSPSHPIKRFKMKYPKNMIISHYNINSVRNKFIEIESVLIDDCIDIFGITETKLDESFPRDQFKVNNFKLERQDRDSRGGGIMVYVRDTIPHRIEKGTHEGIDFMIVELSMKNRKWNVIFIYRPPRVNETIFCDFMSNMFEDFSTDNLNVVLGDLNFDMLKPNKLIDTCELFGLKNLIKSPTCFKGNNPSLVDVILTNKPRCFSDSFNVDLGVSDFHNCIGIASKMFAPIQIKRKVLYRSMRNFNEDSFKQDLNYIPFHVSEIFDDIDDKYWAHNLLLNNVIDCHAPLKRRTVSKQVPYMNSALRKSINQRNMWRSKHFKNRKNKYLRDKYVYFRNQVVKLRNKSIRKYFDERCNRQYASRSFFKTVKPFISSNSATNGSRITLLEDKEVISEPLKVAEIFSKYYASIAEYKCETDGLDEISFHQAISKYLHHGSIALIKKRISNPSEFRFAPIMPETLHTYIANLASKKATGHDGIPSFFVKFFTSDNLYSLCNIFNDCVMSSFFPTDMKFAEISPIFKKKDSLCKENYRSVNILTCISKIFERILSDQLMEYFQNLLSPYLSAYRKGYSCQHVILQLTEYWRHALDQGNAVGTIAMDLSKAFDLMPHALLIAKLSSYGVSENACRFLISYLVDRRQRVKVTGFASNNVTINKGVPQGSVLGPLLFNIFINELFFLDIDSQIANYADDNHIYNKNSCVISLQNSLLHDTTSTIDWLEENKMDVNPGKFQCIGLSRECETSLSFSINDCIINSENHMEVLGVTLDNKLKFDTHVSIICKRAASQINALKRISKYLNEESRILIYKSYISANFNYCPVAWIFCGKKNSSKLEKLQKRALRFVYRDKTSTYFELLKRGRFLSLSQLRLKHLAVEVFKCVRSLNPPYLNSLFTEKVVPYGFRDRHTLIQPTWNTKTYGFRSFRYYGAKLWNALPSHVKDTKDILIFKRNIDIWCHTDACDKLCIF